MTVLGYRKTKGLEAVLRLLRSTFSTVDSSSPATIKTAPDVVVFEDQLLNFQSL